MEDLNKVIRFGLKEHYFGKMEWNEYVGFFKDLHSAYQTMKLYEEDKRDRPFSYEIVALKEFDPEFDNIYYFSENEKPHFEIHNEEGKVIYKC